MSRMLMVSQIVKDSGIDFHPDLHPEEKPFIKSSVDKLTNTLENIIADFPEDLQSVHVKLSGPGPLWAFMMIQHILFKKGVGKISVMLPHSNEIEMINQQ